MSDSYYISYVDKDTKDFLCLDVAPYDHVPCIGDVVTCDGIPYKVVKIDSHDVFKDYNDHGSDYDCYYSITLERMNLSMDIIESLDAEVPFISVNGAKLYCEGSPSTRIYMDCQDGLMSLYDSYGDRISGIDIKTMIMRLCVKSEEQLKTSLGSLFKLMPSVWKFREGFLDRLNIPYVIKQD